MALVGHLRGGPLAAWCARHLPGTPELVREVRATIRDNPIPEAPTTLPPAEWAMLGAAFGQRLAFLITPEPPYAALLGAARAGLLGHPAIDTAAGVWPTHTGMPRASEFRRIPDGWRDLNPHPPASLWGLIPGRGAADNLIIGLHKDLAQRLADQAPPGQLGTTREEERDILLASWILAGWESVYRGGELPPTLKWAHKTSLAELVIDDRNVNPAMSVLRGTTPIPHERELLRLVSRLHGNGILPRLRSLAGDVTPGEALGYAQPLFVLHWAEGDVIVGDTLLDVKVSGRPQDRDITRWLWQLLAYAWLDVDDRYRVRNAGLYLARHGALVTWGLSEFITTLTGGPAQAALARRGFLRCARTAMAADGAAPFRETATVT